MIVIICDFMLVVFTGARCSIDVERSDLSRQLDGGFSRKANSPSNEKRKAKNRNDMHDDDDAGRTIRKTNLDDKRIVQQAVLWYGFFFFFVVMVGFAFQKTNKHGFIVIDKPPCVGQFSKEGAWLKRTEYSQHTEADGLLRGTENMKHSIFNSGDSCRNMHAECYAFANSHGTSKTVDIDSDGTSTTVKQRWNIDDEYY